MSDHRCSDILALFDFDNTIVNDNTDTYIVAQASDELQSLMRTKWEAKQQWTKIMADMMLALHTEGQWGVRGCFGNQGRRQVLTSHGHSSLW